MHHIKSFLEDLNRKSRPLSNIPEQEPPTPESLKRFYGSALVQSLVGGDVYTLSSPKPTSQKTSGQSGNWETFLS